MSIRKMDDGRWLLDIRPQGAYGKRIRKIFVRKGSAEAFKEHILQNFHNNPWLAKPADRRRLSELLDIWWWICPYISRHLLSLNPLQARCRRYSRGER